MPTASPHREERQSGGASSSGGEDPLLAMPSRLRGGPVGGDALSVCGRERRRKHVAWERIRREKVRG
jgi:hypothetical protein